MICNDLDPLLIADSHFDASAPDFLQNFREVYGLQIVDMVATSPPYRGNYSAILRNAFALASSLTCMKMSLNFLDPGRNGHIEFLNPTAGLRQVIVMSREVAGGELGRLKNRSTDVWFLWDNAFRTSSEPAVISFATSTSSSSRPPEPAFSYHLRATVSALDHLGRLVSSTSPSACAALLSAISLAPPAPRSSEALLFAIFDDSSIIKAIGKNAPRSKFLLIPSPSPSLEVFPDVDWVWVAPPRRQIAKVFAFASAIAQVGIIFRVHSYCLEPNSKQAPFILSPMLSDVVMMSRGIVRGVPTLDEEGFPNSRNMYTEMWLVWRKHHSGPD